MLLKFSKISSGNITKILSHNCRFLEKKVKKYFYCVIFSLFTHALFYTQYMSKRLHLTILFSKDTRCKPKFLRSAL